MLNKRVCFVLGAGASAPYGFPTAGEMVRDIAQQPDDWWPLVEEALGRDCHKHHDAD